MPYQFKDNAITAVPVETYEFEKSSSSYRYEAAKSFPAYEEPNSEKVVYTVNEGDDVTFDQLYISKSGEKYFRMINTNGKNGWIKSEQRDLFVNAFIESRSEDMVYLNRNTLYKYDLNGDNKVDEIKYKYTEDKGIYKIKLYINKKLCIAKEVVDFGLQVCDLDKNDNYLDLFIAEYPGNDYVTDAFFMRYNGKSLKQVAFNPEKTHNICTNAYEIMKLDGVTIDSLCVSKSGKTYFRVIDTNGKIGWIRSDQKNIISNVNLAG